mmetsp:Transcript_42656/g.107303  ORF Transcript_42656/g.107303 Transcript_42656/m.107303 type:complete len:213 (+) Transcript_42656:219-857(+)
MGSFAATCSAVPPGKCFMKGHDMKVCSSARSPLKQPRCIDWGEGLRLGELLGKAPPTERSTQRPVRPNGCGFCDSSLVRCGSNPTKRDGVCCHVLVSLKNPSKLPQVCSIAGSMHSEIRPLTDPAGKSEYCKSMVPTHRPRPQPGVCCTLLFVSKPWYLLCCCSGAWPSPLMHPRPMAPRGVMADAAVLPVEGRADSEELGNAEPIAKSCGW